MSISRTMTTVGVGVAVIVGSMLAVNAANAHYYYGNSEGQSNLVERLATELNVDSANVQGVFDTLRTERQAENQAKQAERLAGFVENGTLTQAQADALQAKQAERKVAREALRDQNLSREEMREQMEASRDEFEAWAEGQGIDLDAIRPEGGPNGRGSGMGHGPRGGLDS
jgi:pyruvate/2-oxoglutarate dehydrogenase complex dihydrolipoamide acyltransferase (E2) component